MWWIVWGGVLLAAFGLGWIVVVRPFLELSARARFDRARGMFRVRRERLEARFVTRIGVDTPAERRLWEDATWEDSVVWARNRSSRRLTALIGVRFRPLPAEPRSRRATAVFEFRGGSWHADGKRLDAIGPDEVCERIRSFELVALPRTPV